MTLENMIQGHLDRIATLNDFLRLAYLGRRSKESAVARKVRRNLIGEIEVMIDEEREQLDVARAYLDRTTESQRAHDDSVVGLLESDDEAFADFSVRRALLDIPPLFTKPGRAYNVMKSRWYDVEEGYPKRVAVPAEELGDLAALIARVGETFYVDFIVERFFWSEDALLAWTAAQEERDGRRE